MMINVDIEQNLPNKRYEDMLFYKPRNKPCLPKDLTDALATTIRIDPSTAELRVLNPWRIPGGFRYRMDR